MRLPTIVNVNQVLSAVAVWLIVAGCGADADDTSRDVAPDIAVDSTDVDAEGQLCGPGHGDYDNCPGGYQCVWREAHSGGCEGTYRGVCESIPTECPSPTPEDFVCLDALGCIGVGGFASECIARSRGYLLELADWPCLGVECEVAENQTWCPPDVACISSESECDDGGSTSGTCQYAPTSCDPAAAADTRCACDGTRYESECHARLTGYFGTLTVCEGSGE